MSTGTVLMSKIPTNSWMQMYVRCNMHYKPKYCIYIIVHSDQASIRWTSLVAYVFVLNNLFASFLQMILYFCTITNFMIDCNRIYAIINIRQFHIILISVSWKHGTVFFALPPSNLPRDRSRLWTKRHVLSSWSRDATWTPPAEARETPVGFPWSRSDVALSRWNCTGLQGRRMQNFGRSELSIHPANQELVGMATVSS